MHIGNITLRLVLLIATLMLCGCGKTDTCLEPDDFGFTKIKVSSRYSDAEIFGEQTAEITPWKDEGLILDGKPLYISVKNWIPKEDANESGVLSAWCPWYGDKDHASTLTKYCERLNTCHFIGSTKCSYDSDGMPTDDNCLTDLMCTNTADAQIANPPCLMTKGLGLYALLAKPTYNTYTEEYEPYNPNISLNTMSNPSTDFTYAMHMGAPHSQYYIFSMSNSGKMTNSGGVLYDYDRDHTLNSSRIDYVNGKLYFKILDHFYQDNNGQYRIFIKSGVFNGGWDPISWCISLVKKALFGNGGHADYSNGGSGIVPAIYSAVVVNTGFTNTVRATLMLFVIFSAFGFLMGSIELTQKELLDRVLKVIIIVTLISPGSWKFFNQHIFIWFYEGTDFIINILYQVAASGPGSSNPLDFFFSQEIFIKLSSLLLATPTGWIYILVYLVMLIYLVQIYFDAAVLYMTALIMVGVLISIAPIFIVFFLFSQTKSFFDNWLKQITSYSVQMILVYAGILFMTLIIRNQIYNTLGFPTCAKEFPSIGSITIFKWYFPKISSSNPPLAMIPIPKDHFETIGDIAAKKKQADSALGGGFTAQDLSESDFCKDNPSKEECQPGKQTNKFCGAYECTGLRYPDLPFLDPNDSYEGKLIAQIRDGYIGDFGGLAIIVVCIYLMDHFNKTTVSMAKFLSSTTGNAGNNAHAATNASSGLKSMAMEKVNFVAEKTGISAAVQARRDAVHNAFAMAKYNIIDKPWANYKLAALKEDAIEGGLKSVRKQAEKLSGMSHSEALEFNRNLKNSNYAQELESLLKNHTAINHPDGTGAITTDLKNSMSANSYAPSSGISSGALKAGFDQSAASTTENVKAHIASRAIMAKLNNGKASDFKNIAAQELFGKDSKYANIKGGLDFSKLKAEDATKITKLSDSMKTMLDAKAKQDLYTDSYSAAYIQMSNQGVGLLRKSSSVASGLYNLSEKYKSNVQSWDDVSLERARDRAGSIKKFTDKFVPDAFKQIDYRKLYGEQDDMAQRSAAQSHTDRLGPGGQGASNPDPFKNQETELEKPEVSRKATEKALISRMLYDGYSEKEILDAVAENRKSYEAALSNTKLSDNRPAPFPIPELPDPLGPMPKPIPEPIPDNPDPLGPIPEPIPGIPDPHQLGTMNIKVGSGMEYDANSSETVPNVDSPDPRAKYELDANALQGKKPATPTREDSGDSEVGKEEAETLINPKGPKRTGTTS